MFFAGLFWTLSLPVAFILIFLNSGADTRAIIAYVFMAVLWFAAIKIMSAGIYGFKRNKRAVILIINDDSIDALLNNKRNSQLQNIKFSDICCFSFSSNRTEYNKITKQYSIKPHSAGTINFALKNNKSAVCGFSIYDADVAAKMILAKIDDDQIDTSCNELTKDGKYTPKG